MFLAWSVSLRTRASSGPMVRRYRFWMSGKRLHSTWWRRKSENGTLRSRSRGQFRTVAAAVAAHPGQLLCAPDDHHEDSVQKVPDLTEAGAELDVGLADLQLHQQQLGQDVLDLVKLPAEVVATLRSERTSSNRSGLKPEKKRTERNGLGKQKKKSRQKRDLRRRTWCRVKTYKMSCKESTTRERSCSDMREATQLKNSCTATGAICSSSGMRGSHRSL